MFCPQAFESAAAKDDHILEHFSQETCNDCQQNLIRIGGNLYILHNAATCIKEYDYDSENYYDDVSSKLATVLVEETCVNDKQHTDRGDDPSEIEVDGWIKTESNIDEYETPENPLQENDEAAQISTAESEIDEDSQQQQQDANTSTAESNNDEQLPHQMLNLSNEINMNEVHIKSETVTKSNKNEKAAKKAGPEKRECEFCGEFFHRYALYRHKRDVHNPTVCICQTCNTQFKSVEYLQRHMRYKHGASAKVIKCDTCQATFRKEDLYRIHQCNTTPNNENSKATCETCGKEFSRKQTLLKHQILVHNDSGIIHCKACARVFSDVEERDVHQLECTAKKYQQLSSNPIACEICGLVLSRRGALIRHKALKH